MKFSLGCNMKQISKRLKTIAVKLLCRTLMCIPVLSLSLFVSVVCGCKELSEAVDRHGDYFYLTKNYGKSSVQFSLIGKQLLNQDAGKFVLLPSPTAIFPGIPLFIVENCVICPLIDITLLPTDFWRNLGAGDEDHIRENGYYVQVMDVFGRPVSGVEVRIFTSNRNLMPVVYKGRRQKYLAVRGITDKNGELFVPVDASTVENIGSYVSTAGACEKGTLDMTHYEREYRHPPFPKWWNCGSRFYSRIKMSDVENPDELFPQRDEKHMKRVVLEPTLVWPDGRNAQWSFVPEKNDKIFKSDSRYWNDSPVDLYDCLIDMTSTDTGPINANDSRLECDSND